MGVDSLVPSEVTPPLPVGKGTEDRGFLSGVERDLEALRHKAVRHEETLRQLGEAAPLIHEALKQGVSRSAIWRVLVAHGYQGTRTQLRYFLETHLGRELVRHGIVPDGWTAKPRRPGTGRKALGPRRERTKGPWGGVMQPAAREFAGVTVFKTNPATPESEFERRLASAIRQRKQTGEWQNV